jgi:hypothetical protein
MTKCPHCDESLGPPGTHHSCQVLNAPPESPEAVKRPLTYFGLRPVIVGSPVSLYWGARALYNPGSGPTYQVDVLWDRQSWSDQDVDDAAAEANAPARKVISDWFNARGRALLQKQCKTVHLAQGDDDVIHVQERAFHIIANPKRSYGYLYIAVWKDPHAPEEAPDVHAAAHEAQGAERQPARGRQKRRR